MKELQMDSTKTSDLLNRISIGMEPSRTPLDLEEPSDYVNILDGRIYYSPEDNEADEREEIIGAFRMVYIDANSATENETSLFDVYDCDAETLEFFESFVNLDDEEFTKELTDFLESEFIFSGNNVLPGFHVAKSVKLENLDKTPTLGEITGVLNQYYMNLQPK